MKECTVCNAKLGEKNKSGLCATHYKEDELRRKNAGHKMHAPKKTRNCKCGVEIRLTNKSGLCQNCNSIRYASWQDKKRCLMCRDIRDLNHLKTCEGCAREQRVPHDGL